MSAPTPPPREAEEEARRMAEEIIGGNRINGGHAVSKLTYKAECTGQDCERDCCAFPHTVAGLASKLAPLLERLKGAEVRERVLREALWLGHGHDGGSLYGDDGEMQCNAIRKHGPAIMGPIDFKRDDAERCRDAFLGAIREQFQEATQRAERAEEERDRFKRLLRDQRLDLLHDRAHHGPIEKCSLSWCRDVEAALSDEPAPTPAKGEAG